MAISPAASISPASILQAAQARANTDPAQAAASTNPASRLPSGGGRPHHDHQASPLDDSSTSSTLTGNSVLNILV